ncbi:MAG: hypothetical protein AB4426_22030 [Xenococcaceae cyanobacterium]
MKLTLNKIFPKLSKGIAIAFTAVALLTGITPAVKAQPVIPTSQAQQVFNGLFTPTSSQLFFEEGMLRFEREVQIMLDRQHYSPDRILQISDDLVRQEELLPLENPQVLPNDVDSLK